MSLDIQALKKNMEKAIEHLKTEFSKMRVGRASASMIDGVKVEMYGNQMGIKEVAALAIPDAKTISITPWDKSAFPEIERAILAANLGLTPINDGKMIRINLPPLTEERRKDFVKQIKKMGEDAKVSTRNTRRDALDELKKDKTVTEDASKRIQDEVQKATDHIVSEIDRLVESKSKELMSL